MNIKEKNTTNIWAVTEMRQVRVQQGNILDHIVYTVDCPCRCWNKNGKKMVSQNARASVVENSDALEWLKLRMAMPWIPLNHEIVPLEGGWVDVHVEVGDEYSQLAIVATPDQVEPRRYWGRDAWDEMPESPDA